MLHIMPQSYRTQASRLLQISLLALEVQTSPWQLTPLQLHYAEQGDESSTRGPVKVLSTAEVEAKCEEIEGRMRSRCCGLLETRTIGLHLHDAFSATTVKHQYVNFIHRTVVEFLRTPDVWDDLTDLTKATDFHPSTHLFRSCVLLCRTQPTQSTIAIADSPVWQYMEVAMKYASAAEDNGQPVSSSLLCELDAIVTHHWKNASRCTLSSRSLDTTTCHWVYGFTLMRDTGY